MCSKSEVLLDIVVLAVSSDGRCIQSVNIFIADINVVILQNAAAFANDPVAVEIIAIRILNIEDIPYRWKPEIDYFTSNMQITIDKSIRASRYSSKSFTE